VTKGLRRVLSLYAGRVQQQETKTLEVTPLLKTGRVSGILTWDKMVEPTFSFNHMTRQPSQGFALRPLEDTLPTVDRTNLSERAQEELLRGTLFQPDGRSHMIAAHVQPFKDKKTHAIFVADMDLISNFFFELRQEQFMNLELDNVSFVLNAVDVLAGETSFLELRRRKTPQPSLTSIEKDKEALRAKERTAVNEAKTELVKEQIKLNEAVSKIEEELQSSQISTLSEAAQKFQEVAMTLNAEKQRLEKRQKELQEELDRKRKEAKTEYERGVKRIENRIRLQAVVLPALPAIAMGLIFLSVRLINERREIAPDRRL
jgi:ABC-2 type transport system permease protein